MLERGERAVEYSQCGRRALAFTPAASRFYKFSESTSDEICG
jgi:hypothetical protein